MDSSNDLNSPDHNPTDGSSGYSETQQLALPVTCFIQCGGMEQNHLQYRKENDELGSDKSRQAATSHSLLRDLSPAQPTLPQLPHPPHHLLSPRHRPDLLPPIPPSRGCLLARQTDALPVDPSQQVGFAAGGIARCGGRGGVVQSQVGAFELRRGGWEAARRGVGVGGAGCGERYLGGVRRWEDGNPGWTSVVDHRPSGGEGQGERRQKWPRRRGEGHGAGGEAGLRGQKDYEE